MDQRPVQQSNTPYGDSTNNRQQITGHMGVLIDQNSNLRQQNSHLFEELDALRLQIVQQQANYDQLIQATFRHLSTSNDELNKQLNDYQQELIQLKEENNHIKNQLNNIQEENDHLKKQWNNFQEENDHLNSLKKSEKKQLKNSQEENDHLKKQLNNFQEENDHLRKQLKNSQEENDRDSNENKSFENIQFKGKE